MLFILSGLPFAGKSRLANFLAEQFDVSIINVDEINKERNINYSPIPPGTWVKTYDVAKKRIINLLDQDQNVIFDAANINNIERQPFIDIAEKRKIHYIIIFINTPADICRERMIQNKKTNSRHQVDEALFERVLNRLERPTSHFINYSNSEDLRIWFNHNSEKLKRPSRVFEY